MSNYQKSSYGGGGRSENGPSPIKAVQPEWLDAFTPDTLKWAEETGNSLQAGNVTTAQLRKFFGSVRRLEQELFAELAEEDTRKIKQELLLMKPRLAYSAARATSTGERKANKDIFDAFVKQISALLDQFDKADSKMLKSRFKNFVHILEAVVAYHKLNGGK